MKTYQDFQAAGDKNKFVFDAISEYKTSEFYHIAHDARMYDRKLNTTIMQYQKLIVTLSGAKRPDIYAANHKIVSGHFHLFVTQENQYQLGNGVTFKNDATKQKLGGDKFDSQLQKAGRAALWGAVSYGFWNFDHLEVFDSTEFVPLWDEENGSLSAGIRYWQLDYNKPLRATLYEIDGFTEYLKDTDDAITIMEPKQSYKKIIKSTPADGSEIINGGNYPSFPIIPLWGNESHQSEIVGLKSQIDAYDLIKSGFANDLDDVSQIYWIIKNAGGMEDADILQFLERLKTIHAASVNSTGVAPAEVEQHSQEIPYQSRTAYLQMLRSDMYDDAMALDIKNIASGAATATQIEASYELLNEKCDGFEYQLIEFISSLLSLVGAEDSPTFKRSMLVNQTEVTNMILASAQYLDDETILKHLPFLSPDEVKHILDATTAEEANRNIPDNTTEDDTAEPNSNTTDDTSGE